MLAPDFIALSLQIESLAPYLTTAAAFFLGVLLTWLFLRAKLSTERARSEERLRASSKAMEDLEAGSARLEAELLKLRQTELKLLKGQGELETLVAAQKRTAAEKQQLLEAAEARMAHSFKAISHESLRNSQEQFLNLARTALQTQQDEARGEIEKRRLAVEGMVRPVAESLHQVQTRIGELEQAREGAYANLQEQVRQLVDVQQSLQQETGQLIRALRQPSGRGQWGEMQLRRVVELSGMADYCSFLSDETAAAAGHDPQMHPDLLVQLPGGHTIVVDSKAPMGAYLDAVDSTDETGRLTALRQHARHLGDHLTRLTSPAYRDQFTTSPEFVVLFLPSESILAAALTQDSQLLEKGLEQGVILATPTTLMALLRAVAYGWRHESLTSDARRILAVGSELYTRVSNLTGQFAEIGQSLDGAVRHYNQALGSIESHVLPAARRLETLGAAPEFAALPENLEAPSAPRQPVNVTRADFAGPPVALGRVEAVPETEFEGFAADDPEEPEDASPEEPAARRGVVEKLKAAAEVLQAGSTHTGEIEEEDFEGFTEDPTDGGDPTELEDSPTEEEDDPADEKDDPAEEENGSAERDAPAGEKPGEEPDKKREPDAEGAADDLRAALEESKAS